MTKSELIEAVAAKATNFSRKDVEIIVDTLFESMAQSLSKGDKVEIRGFGSFKIKERDGRQGRNPKAGDGKPGEELVLWNGSASGVLLNKFPSNSAHLMLAPARHVSKVEELTPEESGDI